MNAPATNVPMLITGQPTVKVTHDDNAFMAPCLLEKRIKFVVYVILAGIFLFPLWNIHTNDEIVGYIPLQSAVGDTGSDAS